MAKKSVKKILPSAAKLTAEPSVKPNDKRAAEWEFLQHVAESEHHLRHPEAFKALVDKLGFKLVKLDHKFEVQDAS